MRRTNSTRLTTVIMAVIVVTGIHTISLAQVNEHDLAERDGLLYRGESTEPYTGPVVGDQGLTGQVEAGKRTGEWIWRYDSGAKQWMTAYVDGQRVKSTGWHENGVVSSEMSFENGRPDGPHRQWDESGRLLHEVMYANGKQDGEEVLRNQDGALLYTANYTSGELDGEATWWYSEGRKRWETHYANGKRTGTWSQYDPDGNLLMESTWEDGELVSRNDPHREH